MGRSTASGGNARFIRRSGTSSCPWSSPQNSLRGRLSSARSRCGRIRGALLHPDFVLAIQPLGNHGAIVELYRSTILANDHQHIDRGVARGRFPLACQHVNVDVAIGAEAPAHRATRNMFSEKELIDLGLCEFACCSGGFTRRRRGICHRTTVG